MQELSPLLNLATLANCPPAQERHRLDCLVRWLLANGWAGAVSLGATDRLHIVAGIGELTIGPDIHDWQPVIPQGNPSPPPLPAPDDLRESRLAVCQSCDRYNGSKCTIAGCGCAGQGTPSALFSKCPMGLWQPNA